MSVGVLVAVVLAAVVALTPVAQRLGLPQPVVLTVFGVGVGLVPGTDPLPIDPQYVLPAVLPPLLFAATLRGTVEQFRRDARPIALLAAGLTVASAGAVAVVAHGLGLGWGPAVVLGAVVSPPDPVAATSVARRLSLPPRLVTLLEGEGLFNDATALVLYGVAVSALVTGQVTAGGVALGLVLAVVVGVAVGLVGGWLMRWTLSVLHHEAAETTLTVSVPFATYLIADRLQGSGVLAVLTLGLYLRSRGHSSITSGGWLLGRSVWRFLDYLVTSIVFVLVGIELTAVLERGPVNGSLAILASAVVAVLIVLRLAWIYPAVRLVRFSRDGEVRVPYGAREALVAGWAGMRGVVTVAATLDIPTRTAAGAALPGRATILIVALATVLFTLVVQGLTLPGLVRLLKVGSASDDRAKAAALRRRAAEAALEAVHGAAAERGIPDVVHRAAAERYESDLRAQEAVDAALAAHGDEDEGDVDADYTEALRHLTRLASDAEREVVLQARVSGEVSVEVADDVLTRVESRALRELE